MNTSTLSEISTSEVLDQDWGDQAEVPGPYSAILIPLVDSEPVILSHFTLKGGRNPK